MTKCSRRDNEQFLSGYYTAKLGGPVSASWDDDKHVYEISGCGLPVHPKLRKLYTHGWSLLVYVSPSKAARLRKGSGLHILEVVEKEIAQ